LYIIVGVASRSGIGCWWCDIGRHQSNEKGALENVLPTATRNISYQSLAEILFYLVDCLWESAGSALAFESEININDIDLGLEEECFCA
jgi:hypothetical protein